MTTARPRIYFKKLQADFLVILGNKYEKLTDQRLKKLGAAVRKGDGACFESVGHLFWKGRQTPDIEFAMHSNLCFNS